MLRVFSDEYRTERDLYRKGFVRVGAARAEAPGVWGDERPSAVKWIEDPTPVVGARRGVARVAEFLDAAEVQRRLAESGADRWAPVHEIGRLDDGGAFYATDAYATSAARLAQARFKWDETNSEALRRIVREVLHGLGEIQSKRGRGHGNLRSGNILIESVKELGQTRVFLSDPAPQSVVAASGASEHDDLRALGQALHRLILHKRFRVLGGWPLVEGPEWDAFDGGRANGPVGTAWRDFVGWLLDPAADPAQRSLLMAQEKLRAIPKPKPRDRWKVPSAVGAAAAVLLTVLGVTLGPGALIWINSKLAEYDAGQWAEVVTAYSTWGRGLERFVREADEPGEQHAGWREAVGAGADPQLAAIAELVRDLSTDSAPRGTRTLFNPWKIMAAIGADQEPPSWNPTDLTDLDAGAMRPEWRAAVLDGYTVLETARSRERIAELASLIDRWSRREQIREHASSFQARGWTDAARYLLAIDEALTVPREANGNPQLDAAALGPFTGEAINEAIVALGLAENIERSFDALTERSALRLASFGDPAVSQLKAVADAELREAQSGIQPPDYQDSRPAGSELRALAERAASLDDLSARIAAFLGEGWSRVDGAAFEAGSAARQAALDQRSSTAIEGWLQDASSGEWNALPRGEDPRRTVRLDERIRTLTAALDAHRVHPGLTDTGRSSLTRLGNLLATQSDALQNVRDLPWVQGQRGRIESAVREGEQQLVSIAAGESALDAELDAFEQQFIAGLAADGAPVTAEVLESAWSAQLAALEQAFAQADDFRIFHDAALAWRSYLGELDASVPPIELDELPTQLRDWSLEPLAQAVRTYRETILAGAIEETVVEPAGPANADAVLARGEERMGEYRSWLADVTRMTGDFARAEALLDSGRTPWDADSTGASADALITGWTDSPVFDSAKAAEAFAPTLARLARADGVRRSADVNDLSRLARGEGDAEPGVCTTAWRRLGELRWPTSAEQIVAEQAAGDHLLTLADTLPEIGAALRAEVTQERPVRWSRAASAASSPEALSALLDLDLEGAFGVDRAALPARVRYNIARHTLGRYVGREFDASEDQIAEQMRATIAAAHAFERESPAEAAGIAALASRLEGVLREAESVERLDFSKVGPGQIEGWTFQDNDLQTEVRFATPREGGATIGFRLVYYGQTDEAFFISSEEVSIGLLQDGVRRADWAEAVGDAFSLAAQVERNWDGPRAWDWDFQKQWRSGLTLNPEGWLTMNPQAGDEPLFAPEVAPEPPSREHPLTHVSPRAAQALAELLGSSLPTASEWQQALAQHEGEGEGQPWNLRDSAWARQRDYVADKARAWRASGGLVTWQFPDAGAFTPGRGVAEGEQAEAHEGHDDGVLFFQPVGEGPGKALKHMIGNAAEFVRVDEGQGFAVIGASALSPPRLGGGEPLAPDQPFVIAKGFNQDLLSYSDVGFRLMFKVGRVRAPFSRSLATILEPAQYRFGGGPLGLLDGDAGVAPLRPNPAGERDGGLEHRPAERVTRGEGGSR